MLSPPSMAVAIQPRVAISPEPAPSGFTFDDLRVFTSIPEHHHDVTALLGLVVVYDTDTLCREDIQEGALYVVEDHRPVGGMSWEIYDRLNREHGPREPRVRIKTSRRVIRAVRCEHDPGLWWQVLPSGHRDGPIYDWAMAHNFVGKVVGIYRPNCRNEQ